MEKELEKGGICCFCGAKFSGYGNNAEPVSNGRCCDWCNFAVVIPARVRKLQDFEKAKKDK